MLELPVPVWCCGPSFLVMHAEEKGIYTNICIYIYTVLLACFCTFFNLLLPVRVVTLYLEAVDQQFEIRRWGKNCRILIVYNTHTHIYIYIHTHTHNIHNICIYIKGINNLSLSLSVSAAGLVWFVLVLENHHGWS